jgi:hypothetical protein
LLRTNYSAVLCWEWFFIWQCFWLCSYDAGKWLHPLFERQYNIKEVSNDEERNTKKGSCKEGPSTKRQEVTRMGACTGSLLIKLWRFKHYGNIKSWKM